jgi:hypothetical protein
MDHSILMWRSTRPPDADQEGHAIMSVPAHKRTWLIALAVTLLVLAGAGVVAFQPWTANHFQYALAGRDGLPFRVTYTGRSYANTGMCARAAWCDHAPSTETACRSRQQLVSQRQWPLTQVGSIPTVFGPSHAVFAPPVPAGRIVMELFVVDGDDCYITYTIEGGP